MDKQKSYKAIGLMSGTSLDGLDIAYAAFEIHDGKWQYNLIAGETFSYDDILRDTLKSAHTFDNNKLAELSDILGELWLENLKAFIAKHNAKPDLIASHGHTIFHNPKEFVSLQIGEVKKMAKTFRVPVFYDFRILDIILGGQGAPLVPIGDKLLFSEYDYCLNLGGIANISYQDKSGQRLAFDVSPCNLLLNHLSQLEGKPYDDGGALAKKGDVNTELLTKLSALPYFSINGPKSLGKENIEANYYPLLKPNALSTEDALSTCTEHIALEIAKCIKKGKVLVTGGGTHNTYLIDNLKEKCPEATIVVPNNDLVEFKEALIFALIGILRYRQEINTLASVTGASDDSCGGKIIEP